MEESPRGIAVLDVGATNVKALLFDADLTLLAEETIPAARRPGPPYLQLDAAPVLAFATAALPRFDALQPVDAIVPCTHGSAAALLDAAGDLALPIMSYEAEPPAEAVDGYAAIAPPFAEVFAPTNPLGLTLARQLYWQEISHPEAFARATTILPLAQYLAFRLCGVQANEVSAMGAQTHLWAPLARTYSGLARQRGWATRFPPLRSAWEPLGQADQLGLHGRAAVLTGVHDSNANLLPHLGGDPVTLLSTGTWIIGFVPGVDLRSLDPARDQVSNTTVFGDPIACFRFMGGREFDVLAEGAPPELADGALAAALLSRGVVAWPSFTDTGGPLPGSGGRGRVDGATSDAGERASLAALYCAQMSALALRAMGGVSPVVVDGPFAGNAAYLEALAACLPGRAVFASTIANGTARGAASLALITGDGQAAAPPATPRLVAAPAALAGHPALARWFDEVERQ